MSSSSNGWPMCAPMTTSSGKSISTSSSSTGSWQRDLTLRSGDADVDRHGQAQLFAGGVDGVVQRVVEGILVDQRRHPHEVDGSFGGPSADGHALLPGPVRAVDRGGQIQPVASLGGEGQGVVVDPGQRGAQDRPVNANPVHLGHQVDRGHAVSYVDAEESLDRAEPRLAQECGGRLLGQRIHPEVDDHGSSFGSRAIAERTAGRGVEMTKPGITKQGPA